MVSSASFALPLKCSKPKKDLGLMPAGAASFQAVRPGTEAGRALKIACLARFVALR
jgi:hypothetical protein